INGVLPTGFAEFEVHSSRTEFEVRVRQVNIPPGSSLTVFVNNASVGSFNLENNGEGRLRLRSDNGQTVPAVVVGTTVQVRFGTTVILSGTFGSATATPTPSPSPTGTPGPTPSPSPALGRSFEAHLTASGSLANGEFKVNLNAAETQATIFGEFHNLSSNQTGARIETTTGTPVVVHSFGVVGGSNGNFASVTIPVTPTLVQQLRTGLWQAVITSVSSPNGEIRGQFTPRSNNSDFDGDGRSDVAVYRPSTGTWFALNDDGFTAAALGSAQDKVVSADYDGDGKTDRAVFKPSASGSTWEISRSSDGGTTLDLFGVAGDIPIRGDFDGDGRNDIAVFRPSNSTWYSKTSGTWGFNVIQFGAPGDIPIPADMDGDGKADIRVFRPSTGQWFWLTSAQPSFNATQFGVAGDIPVRGDFDGDGLDDISVYRPSNGTWYTRGLVGGFRVIPFGENGDVPVPARYDNDNITDIAVFRPSTGMWYFLRSADASFQAVNFGVNGDIPAISQ
ncbi:MAG: CHRD domain-containing protein, partial [Acidobacteria bacterium]|nr:CHRD domain-containing protein [Acidobacteriota bacterium]